MYIVTLKSNVLIIYLATKKYSVVNLSFIFFEFFAFVFIYCYLLLSSPWILFGLKHCLCLPAYSEYVCADCRALRNPLFEKWLKRKPSTFPRVPSVVPLKPTVGLNKERVRWRLRESEMVMKIIKGRHTKKEGFIDAQRALTTAVG